MMVGIFMTSSTTLAERSRSASASGSYGVYPGGGGGLGPSAMSPLHWRAPKCGTSA